MLSLQGDVIFTRRCRLYLYEVTSDHLSVAKVAEGHPPTLHPGVQVHQLLQESHQGPLPVPEGPNSHGPGLYDRAKDCFLFYVHIIFSCSLALFYGDCLHFKDLV